MSAGAPNSDPLAPLGLPAAIRAQASKLLRAADRAEGFALGIETLRALNPGEVEGLYLVFDRAFQARQAELGA
jgi:hypothetical protein